MKSKFKQIGKITLIIIVVLIILGFLGKFFLAQ